MKGFAITIVCLLFPVFLKAQPATEGAETFVNPITFTIEPQLGVAAATRRQIVPQRVAGPNTVHAQPVLRRRTRRNKRVQIADDVPSGSPIAGQYIVVYKDDVADASAATAEATAAAQGAVAAAFGEPSAAAAAAETTDSITTESAATSPPPRLEILSVTQAPAGVPSTALIQVPPGMSHASVLSSVANAPQVAAVVPNRVVSIQARMLRQTGSGSGSCSPPYFAAGVRGQYAPGVALNWPNCLTGADTAVALFGERCGSNMDRFQWTGIFAFKPATGQAIDGCVMLRSSMKDNTQLAQFFGSCGVSPTLFVGLPTNVCPESGDSTCVPARNVGNYGVQTSTPMCSDARSNRVTFQGVPCGPGNALIQWNAMAPTGCTAYSRSHLNQKMQSDWLGKCGVPPLMVTGMPTRICGRVPPGGSPSTPANPPNPPATQPPTTPPNPPADGSTGPLPAVALKSGERLDNWGMAKVGAYDASKKTTVDASSRIAATGIKVAVIDTGVEATHPDLNVIEFVDFFDAKGSTNYMKDGNGHGTHVAGIIGARNQGQGLFGVVPNLPILAFKTLGANGQGALDIVWAAYADVISRLQKGEKIAAVNLSLGAQVSDGATVQTECAYVSRIAAYGTAVVSAAGNSNSYLGGFIPSTCADSMTVTSLTSSDTPSSFSNFAYSSTDASKLNTLIAAPGSNIWSTYIKGSYQSLSGTSMATPFVTGGFAQCFLSGSCKLGTSPGQFAAATNNYPLMLAAAQKCGDTGKCGPAWGSRNYYGYLLNVRPWRA